MIKTQLMQDRGMQVMNMHPVFNPVITDFVGFSITKASFDATSGHPHGKSFQMMIPAIKAYSGAGFHHGGSAKFSPPDDQGLFQQPPLFQVADQGGHGLVDGSAGSSHAFANAISSTNAVRIPPVIIKLYKPDTFFHQTSRQQAIVGEDRKRTRLNSMHYCESHMPFSV